MNNDSLAFTDKARPGRTVLNDWYAKAKRNIFMW